MTLSLIAAVFYYVMNMNGQVLNWDKPLTGRKMQIILDPISSRT